MDRRVVEVINAMPERNRFVRGLRAWCGFRQIGLSYERDARAAGEPNTLHEIFQAGARTACFHFPPCRCG